MSACAPFRAELERALAGSARTLARLASHEHARACAPCRAELSRERALERLLERVPAPAVPDALARRIVARLARGGVPAPGVAARDGAEDVLEDVLSRIPPPRVPAGLAARVLQGLAPEREARRPRSPRLGRFWSAAAVLALGLALWGWSVLRPAATGIELAQGTELEVDEELLVYAAERWELLQDEDLDLWLASLDPVDELLIEYAGDEAWPDDGLPQASDGPRQANAKD